MTCVVAYFALKQKKADKSADAEATGFAHKANPTTEALLKTIPSKLKNIFFQQAGKRLLVFSCYFKRNIV